MVPVVTAAVETIADVVVDDSSIAVEPAPAPVAEDAVMPSRAEVFAVYKHLAPPRRPLRLDALGTHEYRDRVSWAKVLEAPPQQPFAVQLASDRSEQFYLGCLDLDPGKFNPDPRLDPDEAALSVLGAAAVQEDLVTAREFFAKAEVPNLVVRSGPTGGYHLWFPAGCAPKSKMKALARALRVLLPTLDITPLMNAKTGGVRPPGAPHRAGGRAEIDPFFHGRSAAGVRAALEAFAAGGGEDAVERIWEQLPVSVRAEAVPVGKPANRPAERADDGYDRLKKPWRQLSTEVAALSIRELKPSENASAVLRSIVLGCVWAGWSFTEFERHCEASPAAVHARARRDPKRPKGERIERRAEARKALLEDQWRKAVADVRTLPASLVGGEDAAAYAAERQAAVAAVLRLQEQMRLEPLRWATKGGTTRGGACDEKALYAFMVFVLKAGTLEVGVSGRALAEEAGFCQTTAARALKSLAADSPWNGPAWIEVAKDAEGPNSRVYRLKADRVSPETAPEDPETDTADASGEAAPVPDNEADTADDQAKYLAVDITRSQRMPAPQRERPKGAPLAALQALLALYRHDLWHPQRGLGHDLCRTYVKIRTERDPGTHLTLSEVALLTGYPMATVIGHVARQEVLGLVVTGRLPDGTPVVRATDRSLDAVAHQLNATGVLDARVRRHRIERELWHWWCAELAWRTTSREDKKKILGVPAEVIREYALPDDAVGSLRWKYGRFPTTADGRADFAAARRTVASTLNP